jgi:hypothetical protein
MKAIAKPGIRAEPHMASHAMTGCTTADTSPIQGIAKKRLKASHKIEKTRDIKKFLLDAISYIFSHFRKHFRNSGKNGKYRGAYIFYFINKHIPILFILILA